MCVMCYDTKMQVVLYVLLAISSTLILSSAAIESECGSKIAHVLIVSKSSLNQSHFTTMQDAVKAIPSNDNRWTKIFVSPGVYKEKIEIPKDKQCVILQGSHASNTIVTFEAFGRPSESGTFSSYAQNFKAKRIRFVNSAGLNGKQAGPAPAVRVYGDKSAFYECDFVGYQDTLWDAKKRHYFKSCYIEGAVDFIWGEGQSVYEDCKINVTGQGGYITAQGRDSAENPSGFVFLGGSISGSAKAYLGRAYRAYSRVIYQGTYFSDIIQPEGWKAWNAAGQESNTIYAEDKCTGPGANTANRVNWEKKLTPSELSQYTLSAFVDQDGWIAKQVE